MTPLQIQLINLSQGVVFILAIAFPLYRVLVTGKYLASVGLMYLCFVLWGFAFCLFLPSYLAGAFHDQRVYDHFPDGTGAAGMLVTGWMPSLVFCGIALGLRNLWRMVRRTGPNVPAE